MPVASGSRVPGEPTSQGRAAGLCPPLAPRTLQPVLPLTSQQAPLVRGLRERKEVSADLLHHPGKHVRLVSYERSSHTGRAAYFSEFRRRRRVTRC